MSSLHIRIEGLERVLAKIDRSLLGKPLRDFLTRGTIVVQGHAREDAPVDSGRLRSSIGTEVDSSPVPLFGKVGTNVTYAPFQEFGTGPGHFPPGTALELWARRHGFASGYQVAYIIGKRGGLRPKRFLHGGLEKSMGEIRSLIGRLGEDIRAAWDKR